jgi:hypothetical protein
VGSLFHHGTLRFLEARLPDLSTWNDSSQAVVTAEVNFCMTSVVINLDLLAEVFVARREVVWVCPAFKVL